MPQSPSSSPLPSEGEVVWLRGVVSRVTANAVLVNMMAPGGVMVQYAFSPNQHWSSEGDITPSA